MTFKLEKLFVDVFAPQNGDIVTIMYDLPHGEIRDLLVWQDRREMANEWHRQIAGFSQIYGIHVNPIVTYSATGAPHAEMPKYGICEGAKVQLESVIRDSTIIISMPSNQPPRRLWDSQRNMDICASPACRKLHALWKRRDSPPILKRSPKLALVWHRFSRVRMLSK